MARYDAIDETRRQVELAPLFQAMGQRCAHALQQAIAHSALEAPVAGLVLRLPLGHLLAAAPGTSASIGPSWQLVDERVADERVADERRAAAAAAQSTAQVWAEDGGTAGTSRPDPAAGHRPRRGGYACPCSLRTLPKAPGGGGAPRGGAEAGA